MSFATLSGTLGECSAISRFEITKNPFDSGMEDRLNLPSLSSPSIFAKQETPGSQKKGFRWSIDQISKLDPADIDEFPNQEYSSTYERPEDETKAQEAINEYFSRGKLLPSPWTPEKHVTFSPLPPSTAYISGDEDSMTDVSHNSSNSVPRRQLADVSCQTSLTFSPMFDLSKIVDSGYYSYVEDEKNNENQKLNVSSLRRKLFSQDDNGPQMNAVDQKSPKQCATRSILKSPSPKTLLTSSPYKNSRSLHPDLDSPFLRNGEPTPSPEVSPIKSSTCRPSHTSLQDEFAVQHDATISNDDVFTSNILESSDVCINPSLIPDVSPIKDHKSADQHENKGDQSKNGLGDGGPMKLSELSDVSMDYENELSNENDCKMEMTDLQPLTHPKLNEDHGKLSRDGEHLPQDVMTSPCNDVSGDVNVDDRHDVIHHVADDGILEKSNDVNIKTGDDVTNKNNDDVIPGYDVISRDHNISGMKGTRSILEPKNDMSYTTLTNKDDRDRGGRQRGIIRDTWDSKKENIERNTHGPCFDQLNQIHDEQSDEELVKRASAAMRRAEKLVKETCMEQGTGTRRIGAGILNWSRVDGASWNPIDMSTPVVHDKMKKPQTTNTVDASSQRRCQLSDVDSYNNLLSSFANSRLDQAAPRSYSRPAIHDSGVGTIGSSEHYSKSRGRSLGLETRRRRSLADVRNSGSSSSPRDAYLSGLYGYSGVTGKRFSWPPWKSSRSRYFNGRSNSPTIPSVPSRQRHQITDESRLRRVRELGQFAKPLHHGGKDLDYFDGMHSNSRKTYCR